MGKCKTCKYLRRLKHAAILNDGVEGEEQLGGMCSLIVGVLKLSNSSLWSEEEFYVYESFGCSLHEEK